MRQCPKVPQLLQIVVALAAVVTNGSVLSRGSDSAGVEDLTGVRRSQALRWVEPLDTELFSFSVPLPMSRIEALATSVAQFNGPMDCSQPSKCVHPAFKHRTEAGALPAWRPRESHVKLPGSCQRPTSTAKIFLVVLGVRHGGLDGQVGACSWRLRQRLCGGLPSRQKTAAELGVVQVLPVPLLAA